MKNKIDYITLYHYTDKKISGKLTPRYFGENYYTFNDIKSCNIKRIFFYDIPKPEALLSACRFLYTCRIAKNKIYDITKDHAGYIKKYASIYEALTKIKKIYSGVLYTIGGRNIINLFYSIRPLKIEA